MKKYQFRSRYQENKEYRESFFELAQEVFEIDFREWYERGCWGDDYISYAYFDDKQIVANVSVNLMTITIEGKVTRAIQIGTVMTHQDYRNQGLSKKLMEIIMQEYQEKVAFIYLFANESVLDFYPKFGFREVLQSQFHLDDLALKTIERKEHSPFKQLKINQPEDWRLLRELAENRQARKSSLEVVGPLHLLLFYLIVVFSESLYYIEEIKTLVLFEENFDQIELIDFISLDEVTLEQVLPYLVKKNTKKVTIGYSAALENNGVIAEKNKVEDDVLFIKGDFPLENKAFQFPIISHG